MIVVSHEVFEMLCHPERKPTRKLKATDLVARDSFTGETMSLEIPAHRFPNEIAAHECGHVVALAAAGLADEFTSVTIVPQNGVKGLTTRSGASLTELSGRLADHSQRMASAAAAADAEAIATAVREFKDFIATTPVVCLPHLCFFFGGGSCDRRFGRENAARNTIYVDCLRSMVIPAMVLQPPAADRFQEVQDKVDEFLFSAFEKNMPLFRRIYDALVERKTLDRASLGPDILREMGTCASRCKENYGKLLVWFRQWHANMPLSHGLCAAFAALQKS